MRNFVDEIVLAILCCLLSLLASKSEIAIVGLLAAVVLICICAYANKPVRISAQILFCLCAIVIGDVFFYLPVVVYLALRERSWLVRLIWIAPLVGVMALNASGVTGSYGIGLQVQGSLIAEGLAASGIADAFEVVVSVEVLLCAIAVVLAVRNLRETSEREAYRFAYDNLREGYLSLTQAAGQNTEEDNETARLIAHEAERFADLTERGHPPGKKRLEQTTTRTPCKHTGAPKRQRLRRRPRKGVCSASYCSSSLGFRSVVRSSWSSASNLSSPRITAARSRALGS